MPLRVYFPQNSYLLDLTKNYHETSTCFDLIKIDENTNIIDLLNNNQVDLALIDPLTFANISSEIDYCIVPTKCFLTAGYTGIINIYFGKYLRDIKNIAFSPQNRFLAIITSIILKEKYSFETELVEVNKISLDDLKKFDTVIETNKRDGYTNLLDLTEEWFDTFEYPLPIAFWVAREGDDYETIVSITESFFQTEKNDEMIDNIRQVNDPKYEREGYIFNQFSDDTIKSIEEIIKLLYQLGLIDNMKDVKILGGE